jgi:hypothetical protein
MSSSSSLHYTNYDEFVFRASVDAALARIQSILDTTRHPRLAQDDEQHKNYTDKYLLAEFVTNTAQAAILNVLQAQLGLNHDQLQQVIRWVQDDKKTVTLRFDATDGCTLIKEQQVKITSPHEYESETTTTTTTTTTAGAEQDAGHDDLLRGEMMSIDNKTNRKTKKTTSSSRVIRTVTEYHWKVEVSYQISIFAGDASSDDTEGTNNVVELETSRRHVVATIVTAGGGGGGSGGRAHRGGGPQSPSTPPIPEKTVHAPIDVNLTWLFSTMQQQQQQQQQQQESNDKEDTSMLDDDQAATATTATAPVVHVVPRFTIDRNNEKTCKTPRRNAQVQDAVDLFDALSIWASNVRDFIILRLAQTIDARHQPMTTSSTTTTGSRDGDTTIQPTSGGSSNVLPLWELEKTARSIFVPILPLMENGSVLSDDDANQFLHAQLRSMQQAVDQMQQMYPPPASSSLSLSQQQQLDGSSGANNNNNNKIISSLEATLVLLSHHVNHLCTTFHSSVDYIEEMLRNQLIAAIGREVQPRDFDAFMHFYYKKLFGARYAPRPFTYAIRQPNHYPDGILSVEDIGSTKTTSNVFGTFGNNVNNNNNYYNKNNNKVEPVVSLVRHVPAAAAAALHDDDDSPQRAAAAASIFIPINAATSVEITGDRYIHGWMQHQFLSSSSASSSSCMPSLDTNATPYQLAARARQFCSFMIIIGNMAGPDTFQPKEAIILQNKDEVLIPLLTKVLPSAREFRDAIASLSPQQQDFAQAFRSMQLETSVFGVVVVQIKPQLEKLLRLPRGALTKEIQLTQDLMSLFVDYQIPSDLLSFDNNASAAALLPDGSSSSSSTEMTMAVKLAAVKGHVKSVMDVLEAAKEKQLMEEERKADARAAMQYQQQRMAPGAGPAVFDGALLHRGGAVAFGSSKVRRSSKQAQIETMDDVTELRMHANIACSGPPIGFDHFCSTGVAEYSASSYPHEMVMGDTGAIDLSQATGKQATKDQDLPQKKQARLEKDGAGMEIDEGGNEDYTMIPKLLDAKLEAFDTDNSLRPTIIEAGSTWTRKRQENLLTVAQTRTLDPSSIQDETKKAFDLLDALSRSGTLPIDCAELHVMVGVTHCFENDVMGTVIQDNINPIHKVEKSLLMLASTIFREPASSLLHDGDAQLQQRLTASFPQLFLESDQESSQSDIFAFGASKISQTQWRRDKSSV